MRQPTRLLSNELRDQPEGKVTRWVAFCVFWEDSLNSIKVRKLLITAGVYQSDVADAVQQMFQSFRTTQDYKTAVSSTMVALHLSRPSVISYLPYEKGVYFPEDADAANISTGAERQRHYRAVTALKKNPCEETLWKDHKQLATQPSGICSPP